MSTNAALTDAIYQNTPGNRLVNQQAGAAVHANNASDTALVFPHLCEAR